MEESTNKKRIRTRNRKIGEKEWWDGECRRTKRAVKNAYKKWRKGKGEKEEYIRRSRDFRELCIEKKKRRMERLKKEIRNIRTEA